MTIYINRNIGQIVTLQADVNADATAPVSYQWYRNGIYIPGAVDSTYTFTVTANDAYSEYTVSVQNPCGQAVAEPWQLGDTGYVCKEYECDAISSYWLSNKVSNLYWPGEGQTVKLGQTGMWSKEYMDSGDASWNLTNNVTQDFDVNVAPVGVTYPLFCAPPGIVHMYSDSSGLGLDFSAADRDLLNGDKTGVRTIYVATAYYQTQNSFDSGGQVYVAAGVQGVASTQMLFKVEPVSVGGQPGIRAYASGPGNQDPGTNITGAEVAVNPDSRMVMLVMKATYQAYTNGFGRPAILMNTDVYINGSLVSSASYDCSYDDTNVTVTTGFRELDLAGSAYYAHAAIGLGINIDELQQAFDRNFEDYVDPNCA